MKYKVGDKVIVRPDLDEKKHYDNEGRHDGVAVTPDMVELAGQVVTIKEVREGIKRYFLAEDPYEWCWVDGMFTGKVVESESQRRFKVGDVVVGNKTANDYYGITVEGWQGRVEDVSRDGKSIEIRGITTHKDSTFGVKASCFDLVEEAPQPAPEPEESFSWEDLF